MPDFMLQFLNQSKTVWNLAYARPPRDENSLLVNQIGDRLEAKWGKQVLAWDLKDREGGCLGSKDDSADGQVIWTSANGKCFGVQIRVPAQWMGLGNRPCFQVKTILDGEWTGEYSGKKDKFNFDKAVVGHDIFVDANSQPFGMTLTVTIKDL